MNNGYQRDREYDGDPRFFLLQLNLHYRCDTCESTSNTCNCSLNHKVYDSNGNELKNSEGKTKLRPMCNTQKYKFVCTNPNCHYNHFLYDVPNGVCRYYRNCYDEKCQNYPCKQKREKPAQSNESFPSSSSSYSSTKQHSSNNARRYNDGCNDRCNDRCNDGYNDGYNDRCNDRRNYQKYPSKQDSEKSAYLNESYTSSSSNSSSNYSTTAQNSYNGPKHHKDYKTVKTETGSDGMWPRTTYQPSNKQ